MVVTTTMKGKQATGKLIELFGLRRIEANCLILAPASKKSHAQYRAVVEVKPVNFALLSEGEQQAVLEGFRAFLGRLTYEIMIHVRVERYDLSAYLAQLEDAATNGESEPLRMMARDHKDFILNQAATKALLQRKFYLVVGADYERPKNKETAEEEFDRARAQLHLRTNDIVADLERATLKAYRLVSLDLARYYHACIHRLQAEQYPLPASVLAAVERPIQTKGWVSAIGDEEEKKQEARSTSENIGEYPGLTTLPELIAPSAIEIKPGHVRIRANAGDEFIRGYAIAGYPAEVGAGWLYRLIELDEPDIDLHIYIAPLESAPFVSGLGRKLTGLRATQRVEERHGRTPDPYIMSAREQIERLQGDLARRIEQVFGVSIYLLVRAYSFQQLRERSNRLLSLLKSMEMIASELTLEHHLAWQGCLPDMRDYLRRRKVLDTSSLMMSFPFASASLSTSTGIFTGITADGGLLIIDPTSDLLDNGHEVKFARSGAGKSYDEKVRIGRALLAGMRTIVIDPEDEYDGLVENYGGIHLSMSSSNFCLNPFDLPQAETDRGVLHEQMRSLLIMFDLLLAKPGVLTEKQKSTLSKCMTQCYTKLGISADPATHHRRSPDMSMFHEHLTKLDEELADRLERYLHCFPSETPRNLDVDHYPAIAFGIRDLPDDETKAVGLFLVMNFVWVQVRRVKHPRPCLLSIDEAWALLQHQNAAQWVSAISRRARKYNLYLRIISQDVEDCLQSEAGRTILINSATKFLMKQDSATIDEVVRVFRLSEREKQYLLGASKGEGLYFARNSHVAIRVVASEVEHRLATTNREELRREALAKALAEQAAMKALYHNQTQEEPDALDLPYYNSHVSAES